MQVVALFETQGTGRSILVCAFLLIMPCILHPDLVLAFIGVRTWLGAAGDSIPDAALEPRKHRHRY